MSPRLLSAPLAALAAALVLAAPAAAATAPSATTGTARDVAATTATARGSVNPHGTETSYVFEYGRTTSYGARTASASAGSGTTSAPVSASITGLTPQRKYHFRLVAFSPAGTTRGADRTFTTPKVPVTVSISATPNPVLFGGGITVSGAVAAAPAGSQVVLQSNPFPYTAGFTTTGNPQVTGAGGSFSFPVLALLAATQFRVRTTGSPSVTSAVATVDVSVRVSLRTRVHRVRRGALVRLSGDVSPVHDGAQLAIQKLVRGGRWVNVLGTSTRHGSATSSHYDVTVRTRHSGRYRVFVRVTDGDHVSGTSDTASVRLTRRR